MGITRVLVYMSEGLMERTLGRSVRKAITLCSNFGR